MPEQTTYVAISRDDLKDLVLDLGKPTMLDMDGVAREFGFSASFVHQLRREGRIRAYPVEGHPKVVRYSYIELKSIFNQQQ